MNNPNLMRPQGSASIKLVQSTLGFTARGLQILRQNPHNNQLAPNQNLQQKIPPPKAPKALFDKKKKKTLKPKPDSKPQIPLDNNIIKDERIQPNNWLRWTSLQQFIQKSASFAVKTIESTQSDFKPDLQNIPNLISKIFKRCSSLFNMDFNILPGQNSKLELLSFDIFGGYLGLLYGLVNDILATKSQDPKIIQYQQCFQSRDSKYILDWNTIRSNMEYQIILTKSPTFHLDANYKLCQQALANSNNLLNQLNKLDRLGDSNHSNHNDQNYPEPMDIDEFQIDTSTKRKQVDMKDSPISKKYDALSSDQIRSEIDNQNRILATNQKLYTEVWPQVLKNFNKTEMKKADKREETRLTQMAQWYYAKTQYNKFWHELSNDQQERFNLTAEREKLEQDPDPNVHSFLDSNKTTQDLYIDAHRYNRDEIERHMLPRLRILSRLQAKIKINRIKNTFKVNMTFATPQGRQYFLNKWKKIKVLESYLWKGITRWHLKVPTKPRDFNIIPKYSKHRNKDVQQKKENHRLNF